MLDDSVTISPKVTSASFVVRRSSFVVRRSSFVVHRRSLFIAVRRSMSFVVRRRSLRRRCWLWYHFALLSLLLLPGC